ncbi:GntR family transcriptional regulator [Paenibacillus pasadenensis]|uniref:Transcriptional repressor of arabinoside utilization operon, GntR family n=1 Tax=Paenibacillus pasadenensis TaxID=217090 RepID=A0A2N5N8T0_9BACL|nr:MULTISPECIES: GntR family transcriptional regulator [Paenibacillus]PLT46742.1 Transcriptional repressor of arabinoside utilization operon, GntR family [Paenibacillus pasadenensis]QGG57130.1 GntR family transcriptional regulator [Paenibacillus sp. B01]
MEDRQPKYRLLKQQIEGWLRAEKYRADEQLPSENELAAQFGLSRQTVRQTIGELVSEGLLYRVHGKGTFASPSARPGAGGGTAVGMITTYISDYIFPHIVRGAEAELRSRGCGLLLSSTDNSKQAERQGLERMLAHPVKGLIVEPTRSAQGNTNLDLYVRLQLDGIPLVMINERYPDLDCPCVKVDDEAGGYAAAAHLLRLGHTRLAGLFKTDDMQGTRRLQGMLRACREHGLTPEPDRLVLYASEDKASKPAAAAKRLLELPQGERPTALVCYNDELAVQLVDLASGLGLSVPDELSVVGFDDSQLALAGSVKLTTLSHPKSELGARAARLLLDLADGQPAPPQEQLIYAPELIERGSTAPWNG